MLLFVPTGACLMNRMQRLTTAFLTRWASCTGDLLHGRYCRSVLRVVLLVLGGLCVGDDPVAASDFHDPKADHHALPAVPEGFEVTVFAKEPMVRQPCSMAFDSRGRLFVGMGPQYRKPTPETPGDSVVILSDTNGDGRADDKKIFATGFNAVQALAWHGNDLWVANAPDLTVVRDLDGDDEADQYVRLYTDLGNLEHGLHGLNWAPDGKLYMSKGNSKGLTLPGRLAPKPFRDLWGVKGPPGAPDLPEPKVFTKENYQRSFHDPNDDWGLDGGVLRCDDGGANLEIVARGFRNPWDITMDAQFNWLGTDNDQTGGDRIIMPFQGAHFGWNHPWSAHWTPDPHPPTAPVSGPLFEGSGTGIVFGHGLSFPEQYREAFFINDWLNKTTYVWRPEWDGALMRPRSGDWEPFVRGGDSLFRPTDMEVGPDGALWILGWSRGYGAEWKDGKLTNEGRVYRIAMKNAGVLSDLTDEEPLQNKSVRELISQFASPLPVHRIDAQDELVRRGDGVIDELLQVLKTIPVARGQHTEMQHTWALWALGRIGVNEVSVDQEFEKMLAAENPQANTAIFNQRLQAIRILAFRTQEAETARDLPNGLLEALGDPLPRIRFAAVQALIQTKQKQHIPQLLAAIEREEDPAVFYAAWRALQMLSSVEQLRELKHDSRDSVRYAALLALLEQHELSQQDVEAVLLDRSEANRVLASAWLEKVSNGGAKVIIKGRPIAGTQAGQRLEGRTSATEEAVSGVSVIQNIRVKSKAAYHLKPNGLVRGTKVYSDRRYRLQELPDELVGTDFIQTANDDDESSGDHWLSFDSPVPIRVMVAVDRRQPEPPKWISENYVRTDQKLVTDDCTMQIYQRDCAAGTIVLGGNTDAKRKSPCANYLVLLQPRLLEKRSEPASRKQMLETVLQQLQLADASRGEILFKHTRGAGCVKCHRLNEKNGGFAPDLGRIGSRATVRHLVESMIDPDAVITEGFQQLSVLADDGRIHVGVLIEESGLALKLGLADGNEIVVPKTSIEQRKTSPVSAMPSMAPVLTAQQVADVAVYLTTLRGDQVSKQQRSKKNRKSRQKNGSGAELTVPEGAKMVPTGNPEGNEQGFAWVEQKDRLQIFYAGKSLVEYVFRDPDVLRPFFANLKTVGGLQVTRNYPPVPGEDATDHATMHPGLWLAFGDVSGTDFWRNKGVIRHLRFVSKPMVEERRLTFSTASELLSSDQQVICSVVNRFVLQIHSTDWSLIWDSTFLSEKQGFTFGDQEEMGFGARVATPLTEKKGGIILSSTGDRSARSTWGQAAKWCDYSGVVGDAQVGITLMASPDNFRESWWHNRDYGVFVANPFGRAAMKQGGQSTIEVPKDKPFRIIFAASVHDKKDHVIQKSYRRFLDNLKELP